MKVGFTNSPLFGNKLLAIYAAAMTAVAGGILLLPAQTPTPNVSYNLFKIGQTTANPAQLATGWKPVGYACQAADPSQIAQGISPTVCGYKYTTASHNLITTGGIDWLACRMITATSVHCVAIDTFIALSTDATAPAAADCGAGSNACQLCASCAAASSEITSGGLARAVATTITHVNGTTTYQLIKTFAATATFTAVQKSGLFNEPCAACTLPVGALIFENTFSSTNVISGDTLQVTWTVTL